MELTAEDTLRLNVLALQADAVRIDENSLEVQGLKGDRAMRLQLHPTGNPDRYLKQVRELLASIALDSPGGYPLFIRRWTRSGQVDSQRLASLLRLAEPEAVMAVVCAPNLPAELARLAWWCEPRAEYARRMLAQPAVATSALGPELAGYLVEYLPFETESETILQTVSLVLQPGLIDEAMKLALWKRGRSTKSYRIGFLQALPDALPSPRPPRPDLDRHRVSLESLAQQGNPFAGQLIRLLESNGQTFTATVIDVLHRLANQETAVALFSAISNYYGSIRQHDAELRELAQIGQLVKSLIVEPSGPLFELSEAVPAYRREIEAMLFLAHLDVGVLTPILSRTDAVGSVMRKRLESVTAPLLEKLNQLLA